jgi:ElaB/YqjD/DUF883 family membrane-anchored ribosome-binding protein
MKGGEMVNKKNKTVRQKTHNGIDNLMDRAESVNDSGKKVVNDLKEKTMMVREDIDDDIERNPEKSVLIAVGIGALIGVIFTATLMRKR